MRNRHSLKIASGRRPQSTGCIPGARRNGFTLVEMLVATAVLVIILGVTLQIINYANNLWTNTRKRIDTFQEARAGFESMTRKVSQAMLNTYWDYADANGNPRTAANSGSFAPAQYLRQSELHFVSGPTMTGTTSGTAGPIMDPTVATMTSSTGTLHMLGQGIFFQAPLGYTTTTSSAVLPNLLNADGFFIEFSDDNADRPAFLQSGSGSDQLPLKYRLRLKELTLPSENLGVYTYTGTTGSPMINTWFNKPLLGLDPNTGSALSFTPKTTLAQNIIALVILPKRSPNYPPPSTAPAEIAPYYYYDTRQWTTTGTSNLLASTSRNQLPPQVQVTMVAIDEASAARLQIVSGSSVPTFSDSTYGGSDGQALPGGLYTSSGVSNLFEVATSGTLMSGTSTVLYDQYATDLSNLQRALVHQHITYRVYSTDVTILQSKFSDN